MTTFGRLVRDARRARGYSLGQLASLVGRAPASVRRWERESSVPSTEVRERLAEVLGLDPEVLHAAAAAGAPEGPVAEEAVDPSPAPVPPAPAEPETPSDADTAGPVAGEPPVAGVSPRVVAVAAADPYLPGPTEAIVVPPSPPSQSSTMGPPEAPTASWWRRLVDPDGPWLPWIRVVLTAATLLALVWVLVWALGGLFEALGTLWRELVESNG